MTVTQRREWGVLVERALADELDVAHVPDDDVEWHDLAVDGDEGVLVVDVPGTVGVLEAGDVLEVKTAATTICRESTPRPGRWHLSRENHLELVERGGVYALTTYDPDQADPGLAVDDVLDVLETLALVPAETVDVLVESWRPSGHGYDYTQLSTRVLEDVVDDVTALVDSARAPAGGGR